MLSVLFCGIGVWQFLIAVSHFAVSHVLIAVSHTNVFSEGLKPHRVCCSYGAEAVSTTKKAKRLHAFDGHGFSNLKGRGDTDMAEGDRLFESLAFSNRSPWNSNGSSENVAECGRAEHVRPVFACAKFGSVYTWRRFSQIVGHTRNWWFHDGEMCCLPELYWGLPLHWCQIEPKITDTPAWINASMPKTKNIKKP